MQGATRGRWWSRVRWPLAAAGLAGLGLGLGALAQVDDWRRDLHVNWARTAPDASDERLRPLRSTRGQEELAGVVEEVARGLPGWRVAGRETSDGALVVRLVRTTRLLRFSDDVTVRIVDEGQARLLTAESRSRVGKGDLGQNPRNLKALLGGVRARLGRGG